MKNPTIGSAGSAEMGTKPFEARPTSRNCEGGGSPSRLVVGPAVGTLDFERHQPQHSPQRLGVHAVGFHDRPGQRIIQKLLNRRLLAMSRHRSPLEKQSLRSRFPLTRSTEVLLVSNAWESDRPVTPSQVVGDNFFAMQTPRWKTAP